MVDLLHQLSSKNEQVFSEALEKFVNDYAGTMTFDFLNENDLRSKIWDVLFIHLLNTNQESHVTTCLLALRILSRDKTDINKIITNDRLRKIIYFSGLHEKCDEYIYDAVTHEAQKLLCNILFNCSDALSMLHTTQCLDVVFDRMKKYDKKVSHETKLFDIRIVFLATGQDKKIRYYVRDQLRGDLVLIEVMDTISTETNEFKTIKMEDEKLLIEILKTLFNIFVEVKGEDHENLDEHFKMIMHLRKLLINNKGSSDGIDSNVVNLLFAIPHTLYFKVISINSDTQQDAIIFKNSDMFIIQLLIDFLNNRLSINDNSTDNLSPILSLFIKLCKAERLIRKYVRMQVLPPLKDVKNRPEEGSTIRNKLCKLLTCPVVSVKDLVAEFLFVLCKENVARMIKYTGYGNAAGMFANKGLLGADITADYSSESENSDTEEYEKMKDQINPVLGCYEEPKPNPLENMTEEQKELEVMNLVSLVDQLQRQGLIQPCRIGKDGKPKPIEHVLELKNELPKQQIRRMQDNSDSE